MGVGRKEGKAPALPWGCEASLLLERSRTEVTDTWAVHYRHQASDRKQHSLVPKVSGKAPPKPRNLERSGKVLQLYDANSREGLLQKLPGGSWGWRPSPGFPTSTSGSLFKAWPLAPGYFQPAFCLIPSSPRPAAAPFWDPNFLCFEN